MALAIRLLGCWVCQLKLPKSFNTNLKPVAIDDAEKQGKGALVESTEALQPGDIRDGYAAFVYDESGG